MVLLTHPAGQRIGTMWTPEILVVVFAAYFFAGFVKGVIGYG